MSQRLPGIPGVGVGGHVGAGVCSWDSGFVEIGWVTLRTENIDATLA